MHKKGKRPHTRTHARLRDVGDPERDDVTRRHRLGLIICRCFLLDTGRRTRRPRTRPAQQGAPRVRHSAYSQRHCISTHGWGACAVPKVDKATTRKACGGCKPEAREPRDCAVLREWIAATHRAVWLPRRRRAVKHARRLGVNTWAVVALGATAPRRARVARCACACA
jgi:hypothetical protein